MYKGINHGFPEESLSHRDLTETLKDEMREYLPSFDEVCYTYRNRYAKEKPCVKAERNCPAVKNVHILHILEDINECLCLLARYYGEARMSMRAGIDRTSSFLELAVIAEDMAKGCPLFSVVVASSDACKIMVSSGSERVAEELKVVYDGITALLKEAIPYDIRSPYRMQIKFLRYMAETLANEIIKLESMGY